MCLPPFLKKFRVYAFNQSKHKGENAPDGFCYALAAKWLEAHDDELCRDGGKPTQPEALEEHMLDPEMLERANRDHAFRGEMAGYFRRDLKTAKTAQSQLKILQANERRVAGQPVAFPPGPAPQTAREAASAAGRQQLAHLHNMGLAHGGHHIAHTRDQAFGQVKNDIAMIDGLQFFQGDIDIINCTYTFEPAGASREPLKGFSALKEMGQCRHALLTMQVKEGGSAGHTIAIFRTVDDTDGLPRALIFDPNFGEFRLLPDKLDWFCANLLGWYNKTKYDQVEVIRLKK